MPFAYAPATEISRGDELHKKAEQSRVEITRRWFHGHFFFFFFATDMMMTQGQGNPMMVQQMGQRPPQPGPGGVGPPQQGMMVMGPQQNKMRPQLTSQQPPNAIVGIRCSYHGAYRGPCIR